MPLLLEATTNLPGNGSIPIRMRACFTRAPFTPRRFRATGNGPRDVGPTRPRSRCDSKQLSGLVAAMHRHARIAQVVRSTFHAARADAMRAVFQRAQRRGELRKNVDLEFVSDVFNGPLFYRFLFTGKALDTTG